MRPVCPHHPGMRMRLVPSGESLFLMTRSQTSKDRRKEHQKSKAAERLIYRCAVKKCPRVESKFGEVEKYLCRIKGCKNLADPSRVAYSDYICRECNLKRHRERDKFRADKRHGKLKERESNQ